MSHTTRVRETYTEDARRCLVSPALETISPACQRFSTSGFFREMANSRGCDEFSERLHIVLFTLRDPELNAVYNATADVPRELEVMAREWESLNAKAELARMHSRRTLSRGSDVVLSPPPGVDEDTHAV